MLTLTGEENLGVLLRSGRIRYLAASEDESPRDVPGTIERLVRLLRAERDDARQVAR